MPAPRTPSAATGPSGAEVPVGAGSSGALVSREHPLDRAAVDALVRAARVALAAESAAAGAGQAAGAPADAPPDLAAVDAAEFLRAVKVHRVAPLLTAHAAALGMPDALAAAIRRVAVMRSAGALTVAKETLRAHRALADAGIPCLVFKGVALSLQTTGSLSARGGGDVDVLVRPDDVAAAHRALVAAGWRPVDHESPDLGSLWSFVSRMRREALFTGNPIDVDLHWRIGLLQRPLPTAAEHLSRSVTVDVNGTPLPTLSPSDALAAACMHAHLDRNARLRGFIDVVRLLRDPAVRPPTAPAGGLGRLVGDVVAFTRDLLGGVPAERVREFVPASGARVERQWRLWREASVRPIWSVDVLPLRDLAVVYGERARYSGAGPSALMLVVDFALPPERMHPGMGPLGLVRAVGDEAADFVRRRVRRR